MTDLQKAKTEFGLQASLAGYADEWDAYRNDADWPIELVLAHRAYIKSVHDHYDATGVTNLLGRYPDVTRSEASA